MKRLLFLGLVLLPYVFFGQDRQFVFTYQTLTLPKGEKDIELWNTFRTGRQYFYNRLDQRLEFEVGLKDKLQTAFYFNAEHIASAPAKDTLGGIADTSFSGLIKESSFSVSNEWKWRLTDAVANTIGTALYGEITIGSAETELEGKLIFDKKLGKNIIALNLVAEYEAEYDVEKGKRKIHEEFKPETNLAYMRMLTPSVGLGLEIMNRNVMVNYKTEHSALFGGPTLFWGGEGYFLIFNVMPQWMNLKVNEANPLSFNISEYEKFQARVLLGFSF